MNAGAERLKALSTEVSHCILCRLATTRRQTVFGEGNPAADIMFIGEGPGRVEDETGRPFVGPAGELLTRIIENGMKLKRSDVYIANIVKCRPTVNMAGHRDRPPEPDEIEACHGYLVKQISFIKPRVIITLGGPASKFITGRQAGITKQRGHWAEFMNIPVMPTYHPSYLLRQGDGPAKRELWNDIRQVLHFLAE